MKQHNRQKRTHYYILYTLLFVLMAALVYCPFLLRGKSLIWQLDGLQQHYIALNYLGKWGRGVLQSLLRLTPQLPLWDFCIGYGSDILTTFHYYALGDPLNLLAIVTPPAYTESLYHVLIVLRIYIAGVCFSRYCFYMGKNRLPVLAGAFSYIFCGYMLFAAVRHPFFINPMIYLPLLLIGAERIFRREKPTLFIFMVFLSAVSNFYFFYMLAFAVCFYVLVRYLASQRPVKVQGLLVALCHFAGYALIGVAMSAVLLLPVLLQFFGTNRTDVSQSYPLLYDISYYQNCLASFITTRRIGNWTCLGFTLPALLALLTLFCARKQYTALKAVFLAMTIMFLIPFFGKVLNGFSYVSNRWIFLYAGLVSYILTVIWQDYLTSRPEPSTIQSRFQLNPRSLRTVSASLFAVLLMHIAVNAYTLYGSPGQNYASRFIDFGASAQTLTDTPAGAIWQAHPQTEGFFRFETDEAEPANAATLFGVYGTQYYWSLENHYISDFLTDMAHGRFWVFKYNGLDRRTFLDALTGVQYLVSKDSDILPFGFSQKTNRKDGPNQDYRIYENQYALPLGYTYDSYIPYETYRDMEPIERQEAMLQGAVLEEPLPADRFPVTRPSFTSTHPDYTVSCGSGVSMQKDGVFSVTKKDSVITLSFMGCPNAETYLTLSGVRIQTNDIGDDPLHLAISSGSLQNELQYTPPQHRYYNGQDDFLVNLGYHAAPLSSITITFPKAGEYRFQTLAVVCQPMERYASQIMDLKENSLERASIGANTVTGSISLSSDKILCLSIPYSSGWHAMVDGKKTPLQKANAMFLALPLTAGKHQIQLYYRTPGLAVGTAVSGMGFLLLGILLWFRKKNPPQA